MRDWDPEYTAHGNSGLCFHWAAKQLFFSAVKMLQVES